MADEVRSVAGGACSIFGAGGIEGGDRSARQPRSRFAAPALAKPVHTENSIRLDSSYGAVRLGPSSTCCVFCWP